jgi:hypothetical protein
MRLRINPWSFLLRLVAFFLLTFLLWKPLAPYYTKFLFHVARAGVWLSELSTDPQWSHGTTLLRRAEIPNGIFFAHRLFSAFRPPLDPQGIPADWVMANLVLLIPLMLATPAASWRQRLARLALALVIAVVVQVLDMIITIKAFYASVFTGAWSTTAAEVYGLLNAFVQGYDTQLFPFVIWAGIHFRELVSFPGRAVDVEKAQDQRRAAPAPAKAGGGQSRAARRRAAREKRT